MGDICDTCESGEMVPVKVQRGFPAKGNPYKMICDECGYVGVLVSEDDWEESENSYVMPKGTTEIVATFLCPADGCDSRNIGEPDECHGCGVEYEW